MLVDIPSSNPFCLRPFSSSPARRVWSFTERKGIQRVQLGRENVEVGWVGPVAPPDNEVRFCFSVLAVSSIGFARLSRAKESLRLDLKSFFVSAHHLIHSVGSNQFQVLLRVHRPIRLTLSMKHQPRLAAERSQRRRLRHWS